ncbi:MAG: cytidine deaminase [Planctomycetaceae bacterium]|nr:Cytidine deaminase [Planctomycetota bacterium]MCQ3949199.1 cytidine deaminase [Planctomycetota bacterium]NUO17019.1 cytidine deaminase [Planctomycetaceae bacterium]
MSLPLAQMLELAAQARSRAYAPYSKFLVGACVRSGSGAFFTGCNCENASYPLGICAETAALAAMVQAGEREVQDILVLGSGQGAASALVTPCGGCRQRILEFGHEGTRIHAAAFDEAGRLTVQRSFTLGELLPFAFGLEEPRA